MIAAPRTGRKKANPAGLLDEVVEIHHGHTNSPMTDWPQYKERFEAVVETADKATRKSRHALQSQVLIARELGSRMSGYRSEDQFSWPRALDILHELADEWGFKLRAGWDQPPIHHTSTNCWTCGTFTSSDHITKLDEKEGWRTWPDGRVTCGECYKSETEKRGKR